MKKVGCIIIGVLVLIAIILLILVVVGIFTQKEICIWNECMYSLEFYGRLFFIDIILLVIAAWLTPGDEDFVGF